MNMTTKIINATFVKLDVNFFVAAIYTTLIAL